MLEEPRLQGIAEPVASPGAASHGLRENPVTVLGLVLVAALVVMALAAPWLARYAPDATNPAASALPPSGAHWLGTDQFGEDVLSRVIWGARYDLTIAIGAVAVALTVGSSIGAIAGYWGGWLDEIVMRVMDIVLAFPSFVLAMGIAAALGVSFGHLIVAIAITNVPIYANLMRARILSVRRSQYALAAVAAGNPPWRVLARHLVPNCLGPIIVQATLQPGYAILTAAGLSFIGLGVRLPTPEWGLMVSMGVSRIISGQWWISFFPGLAIVLGVMGFNLIGDGLEEILDPRTR